MVHNKTVPMDMKYLRICMLHTLRIGYIDIFSPEDKTTVILEVVTDVMKLKSAFCLIPVNTTRPHKHSVSLKLQWLMLKMKPCVCKANSMLHGSLVSTAVKKKKTVGFDYSHFVKQYHTGIDFLEGINEGCLDVILFFPP